MVSKRPLPKSRLAAEKCQHDANPVIASLVSQRPSCVGLCSSQERERESEYLGEALV